MENKVSQLSSAMDRIKQSTAKRDDDLSDLQNLASTIASGSFLAQTNENLAQMHDAFLDMHNAIIDALEELNKNMTQISMNTDKDESEVLGKIQTGVANLSTAMINALNSVSTAQVAELKKIEAAILKALDNNKPQVSEKKTDYVFHVKRDKNRDIQEIIAKAK